MSALIIRLPVEKRTRLKLVAKSRKVSVSKLIEEMATILLADFDAETRFELRAAARTRSSRGRTRASGRSCGETSAREAQVKFGWKRGTHPPSPSDFRLVALVQYIENVLMIRFFGSHEEYDKIDAETV
jgi:hypothetical protein